MIGEQSINVFAPIKIKTKILIFFILTVLVVYLPTIIHQQLITGSLVNTVLILAVFLVGPFEALFLGLLPSVFALTSGLLPLPLAPIVPFIMISNTIFVAIYHYFGRKFFFLAILAAGFLKFLFLYGAANILVDFLFEEKIALILITMTGWTQFLTAVIGGILAYTVLSAIKR